MKQETKPTVKFYKPVVCGFLTPPENQAEAEARLLDLSQRMGWDESHLNIFLDVYFESDLASIGGKLDCAIAELQRLVTRKETAPAPKPPEPKKSTRQKKAKPEDDNPLWLRYA